MAFIKITARAKGEPRGWPSHYSRATAITGPWHTHGFLARISAGVFWITSRITLDRNATEVAEATSIMISRMTVAPSHQPWELWSSQHGHLRARQYLQELLAKSQCHFKSQDRDSNWTNSAGQKSLGMKWAYERKVDKKTHTHTYISKFHLEIWDICNKIFTVFYQSCYIFKCTF